MLKTYNFFLTANKPDKKYNKVPPSPAAASPAAASPAAASPAAAPPVEAPLVS